MSKMTPQAKLDAYHWMAKRWPDKYWIDNDAFLDGMVEHFKLMDCNGQVDSEIRVFLPTGKMVECI